MAGRQTHLRSVYISIQHAQVRQSTTLWLEWTTRCQGMPLITLTFVRLRTALYVDLIKCFKFDVVCVCARANTHSNTQTISYNAIKTNMRPSKSLCATPQCRLVVAVGSLRSEVADVRWRLCAHVRIQSHCFKQAPRGVYNNTRISMVCVCVVDGIHSCARADGASSSRPPRMGRIGLPSPRVDSAI